MDYLQEIAELREELRRHSIAYYDKDAPTISDFEYDAMMRRLENLEAEHPETVTPDSPTQHVGGHRSEKFSPVHHAVPLESLSDVFSYEELTDFIRKTNETLGGEPLYTVEPKIDGLSVSVTYSDGKLSLGATRGDGTVGENITENIAHVCAAEIKASKASGPAGASVKGRMAKLVVLSSFFRIAEHAVCLGSLLELSLRLFISRIGIGMVLLRQNSVCLL